MPGDRVVETRAKADPARRLLMTVPAVGPMTALGYLTTIDDTGRFAQSPA